LFLSQINNNNIEIDIGRRLSSAAAVEPIDIKNIKITLKSTTLHKEKFVAMGEHFECEANKKKLLKRKAIETSTPAKKRQSIANLSFNNLSQSYSMCDSYISSQASSGYCSQNSISFESDIN